MPNASPDLGRWSTVVSHISSVADLETCARTPRALAYRRGVRCAADLSHLTLLYGPGGLSLRSTTGFATSAGITELCDVSLLDRLRKAGDWLADVLDHLLVRKWGQAGTGSRFRLVLVDGSTESAPASKGSDWRLHATTSRRVGFHRPTYHRGDNGRGTVCVAVYPGDVLVQDRGYARVANFVHAHGKASAITTRIGWRSLVLFDAAGTPFDLLAALPAHGPAIVEHPVCIGTGQAVTRARRRCSTPPFALAGVGYHPASSAQRGRWHSWR